MKPLVKVIRFLMQFIGVAIVLLGGIATQLEDAHTIAQLEMKNLALGGGVLYLIGRDWGR